MLTARICLKLQIFMQVGYREKMKKIHAHASTGGGKRLLILKGVISNRSAVLKFKHILHSRGQVCFGGVGIVMSHVL